MWVIACACTKQLGSRWCRILVSSQIFGPYFVPRSPWCQKVLLGTTGLGKQMESDNTWEGNREAADCSRVCSISGATWPQTGPTRPRACGFPAARGAFAFTDSRGGRTPGRENGSAAAGFGSVCTAPSHGTSASGRGCAWGTDGRAARRWGRGRRPGLGLPWVPGRRLRPRDQPEPPLASPVGLSRL